MNDVRADVDPLVRVLMIAAPILLLVSTIAYATGGGLNGDSTGGLVQIYAMALWIFVVFGLTERVGSERLRTILRLLGVLGVLGGISYGVDAINIGLDNGATLERFEPQGIFALQLPGAAFPLSNLAIAIALFRARVEPRWAAALLGVAAILFPLSRIPSNEALAVAADVVFVVALVPLTVKAVAGARR